MRLNAQRVLKSSDPADDGSEDDEAYEEVYDLLIEGDVWYSLVKEFGLNGFCDLSKMAVIDSKTGMIRLRLASLIEEE